MQFKVYTHGIPQTIVLSLIADGDVTIRGYEPGRANTNYFDEEIDASVIKALKGRLEFNCPIVSDQYMVVEITGKSVLGKRDGMRLSSLNW